MLRVRVIPVLLYRDGGLVKSVQYRKYFYVGDPVNAIKIFNDKEVDEIIFLDILATRNNRKPDFAMIENIAGECFMPVCYGGGVSTLEDIGRILRLGVEKVSLNSAAAADPDFVRRACAQFGSQSIVVSVDVKKRMLGGYQVYTRGGRHATRKDPVSYCMEMECLGAGELLLSSMDRDGTMSGYDVNLIRQVSSAVGIPLTACGGAGKCSDFADAVRLGGASAVAAGSMFVFKGKHRAVLITYPGAQDLNEAFETSCPSGCCG